MDGTTAPKTPFLPEYLKAQVHIPPSFIADVTEAHLPIAIIVQLFIEHIGMPTVSRWKKAAEGLGWPLSQEGPRYNLTSAPIPLIPKPNQPTSSHYTFLGRKAGTLSEGSLPSSSRISYTSRPEQSYSPSMYHNLFIFRYAHIHPVKAKRKHFLSGLIFRTSSWMIKARRLPTMLGRTLTYDVN